jgi:hypothetical protein
LIFTAKTPPPGEIYCKPNVFVDDADNWISAAHKEKFNRVENELSYDFCQVFDNAAERYLNFSMIPGESVPCTSFEHEPTYVSLIHQFETFCSREALLSLTQSFHLLGVLIGGIIAHYMLKV